MKLGSITKRGKASWRIKIELERDPATGKRRYHFETVRGKKSDAEAKQIEIYDRINKGQHVDPSTLTVAKYLRSWLNPPDDLSDEAKARWVPAGLSPKTTERYRQLAEQQIIPRIGDKLLQKLDTDAVQEWHDRLLASGGKDGRPLAPRTVGHAHRVLHRALERAIIGKKVFRNVAGRVKPPKVPKQEVEILLQEQIAECLSKLKGHDFYPIVVTALGSGLRRGELLALQWGDIDLDGARLEVKRSLEQTKAGIRIKPPKSEAGRRSVSLPPSVIDVLRTHRKRQLEQRLALGLGKLADDALVFCQLDGSPILPNDLSRDWCRLVPAKKLPDVSFHALRHTHVSALIDAGLDVLKISKRIGHSDPALTLRVYGHLFSKKDTAAADAIERALAL